MIIGLSGYARSGKDTLGKVLADEYGFTPIAFADSLRELLLLLNPWVSTSGLDPQHTQGPDHTTSLVALLYYDRDQIDWEYAKLHSDDVRVLLQRLGEGVRQIIGEDAWVRALALKLDPALNYVITDVRYLNETTICDQVWRVNREGIGRANDHVSETALDHYDFDFAFSMTESEDPSAAFRYLLHESKVLA